MTADPPPLFSPVRIDPKLLGTLGPAARFNDRAHEIQWTLRAKLRDKIHIGNERANGFAFVEHEGGEGNRAFAKRCGLRGWASA